MLLVRLGATQVEKRRGYLLQHGVDSDEQLMQLRRARQAEIDSLIEQIQQEEEKVAKAEQDHEAEQEQLQRLQSAQTLQRPHLASLCLMPLRITGLPPAVLTAVVCCHVA